MQAKSCSSQSDRKPKKYHEQIEEKQKNTNNNAKFDNLSRVVCLSMVANASKVLLITIR